ncbi:MAG: transcription termination/antitermination protein NusG [Thermosulfidibacteraceae bacterium]
MGEEKASNWYIVHTMTGCEERVKKSILERARSVGLDSFIEEIVIPTREVVELKKGQKKQVKKKLFPGYILVKMVLNDKTWHLVRRTPFVTGFVGGSKPVPINEDEVDKILERVQQVPASGGEFMKGDYVKIIEGPFEGFNGIVDEVYPDKQKLKVLVSIFGRSTPVELDYYQVEKL